MSLKIGDTAPDFEADTTEGRIRFHDWIGDSWAVLFSHPKDFTPVCTTELGYMAKVKPEFERRNVKIIGLSVDSTDDHEAWAKDIEETQGAAPNYPIISDSDFEISKLYGMLPADTSGDAKARTPADNQTVRNVFVVGPDKKVKLMLVYPMTTGRNFDEVLRVIDSLQLTAAHKVATPVNWNPGEDVIIAGSVSDEAAKELFGEWDAPKPYIRIVPQPSSLRGSPRSVGSAGLTSPPARARGPCGQLWRAHGLPARTWRQISWPRRGGSLSSRTSRSASTSVTQNTCHMPPRALMSSLRHRGSSSPPTTRRSQARSRASAGQVGALA